MAAPIARTADGGSVGDSTPAVRDAGQLGPKASAARAWSVILILLILAVLASVDRNVIALMVDPIRTGLGINDFQMGLLQGPAFAVFFLIGSLPMGWVVDRYSSKWAIYLGVTGWSVATIACGLSGSLVELLIARCLVGLCQAVLQPAAWSMAAKLFPANRLSFAIGVLSSGAQIGAATSFLLGGLLIAQADAFTSIALPFVGHLVPWQWVFLAAGVPGLLIAFLIFIAPTDRASSVVTGKPSAKELTRFIKGNRTFLCYHFLGFSLHSAAVFGAAAWVPTYLLRAQGLDIQTVGMIMAAVAVPVGAGGVLFAGWLVDRAFARGHDDAHLAHFARITGGIAVIGGLGFSFGESTWFIVLTFGLIQFLQPFSGVSGAVLQISTPIEYRGRISAAYIMVYNAVGMTAGPSFVAFLSEYVLGANRLGVALALSYALLGSGAATLLAVGRKHAAEAVRRQRQADATQQSELCTHQ